MTRLESHDQRDHQAPTNTHDTAACAKEKASHRFWARVEKTDHCWNFVGWLMPRGYGKVYFLGKTLLAHRFAWDITNGPIPDGLLVCHTCDNRKCVRPAHLFLGTHKDNQADKAAKGRCAPRFGEHHGQAKLTGEQVKEIRALRQHGVLRREIAELYGIHPTNVSKLALGKGWKHIRPEEGLNVSCGGVSPTAALGSLTFPPSPSEHAVTGAAPQERGIVPQENPLARLALSYLQASTGLEVTEILRETRASYQQKLAGILKEQGLEVFAEGE
jgi:hypothetical protein